MRHGIRLKLIVIASVLVIFASIGLYPLIAAHYGLTSPAWLIDRQLKLGLDLKGGVHLVLRVQTDDAIRAETEQATERLRDALKDRKIETTALALQSLSSFRVEGVSPAQDAAFRDAAIETQASFDRSPGVAGSYTFTMKPSIQTALRDDAVVQARETIERRVNELGVAEPSIAVQGTKADEILVQLPGVTAVARAKEIIRSTGLLELKIVEGGPAPTREELLLNGQIPEGMAIVPGLPDAAGHAAADTEFYLVRKAAAVSGRDVRGARPSVDENNRPSVSFTLSREGAARFGAVTESHIGRRLAIVLDGRVQSAPRIDNRITSDGSIHGSFTAQEAQDLALILRTGSLSAGLSYVEERTIGPSLGADSIRSGVIASVIGLALIVTFMLIYYRLSGVNAVIALIFNLIILLGLMAYLGAVMTLPGIAGFVLTMGIGVDSNVLIFERIKEELEDQRGVRAAVNAGFSRVFLTLLDTHVSALIAAAFLFQFGTGPIRGFAVTLSVGLCSNLFTSTFVSKTLFEMALGHQRKEAKPLSI